MLSERDTVLHSWCRQADWSAPTIVGGAGARIHTADGRSILDMSSLAECSNLGHQHPKIVAAIREQAQKLCFVTSAWGAEPRAKLAELLLEKSTFAGGRVFFTLGGADANENAVKFARQATVARGTRSIRMHSAFCTRLPHTPTAARTAARTPWNAATALPHMSASWSMNIRTWLRSSWNRTLARTASSRRLTTGRRCVRRPAAATST